MPQEPVILLTRPQPASDRFAAALRLQWAGRIEISPVMEIVPVPLTDMPHAPGGLILTSGHAIEAAAAFPADTRAYCVGDMTAQRARAAGLRAISAGGDADSLVAMILADRPAGKLLHLRGAVARGDVAARLTDAGVNCAERVVYRAEPRALGPAARAALDGDSPVILPLFSPRSARLVSDSGRGPAELRIAAISSAVADAAAPLHAERLEIARRPEAEAMLTLTLRLLA